MYISVAKNWVRVISSEVEWVEVEKTDDCSLMIIFVPGIVHSYYWSEAASLLGSAEIISRITDNGCQLKKRITALENINKNTK